MSDPRSSSGTGGLHPVETLWREVGLPEYFLGNGGTNTKLYELYDRIRGAAQAAPERGALTSAVIKVLKQGVWPEYMREDDRGLEVDEYVDFISDVLAALAVSSTNRGDGA